MKVWMDIKGYEGLYQASNLGNVRRRIITNLKYILDKDGYGGVNLKVKQKG